jgi:hypothetical protein
VEEMKRGEESSRGKRGWRDLSPNLDARLDFFSQRNLNDYPPSLDNI